MSDFRPLWGGGGGGGIWVLGRLPLYRDIHHSKDLLLGRTVSSLNSVFSTTNWEIES